MNHHHIKTTPLAIVAILVIAAFMIAATITAILLITANDAFAHRYPQRHYYHHHHYHNHHHYYTHKRAGYTGNSGDTYSVNIQPFRGKPLVNAGGNSAVQAVDNSAQCSIGTGAGIGGTVTCLQVPLNNQTQNNAARSITSGEQVVNQNAQCNVESTSNPSCFASPRSLQIIVSK
jgi:hypothetical protein